MLWLTVPWIAKEIEEDGDYGEGSTGLLVELELWNVSFYSLQRLDIPKELCLVG